MSGRYDKAIVSVVVDKALYSFDNEFDYYLPQGVKASVLSCRSAKAVRSVSAL